jgi:hypothetical protein
MKKEQKEFDKVMKEILTPDKKLCVEMWHELFWTIKKAEDAGLNLDAVSKMTKFNYNNWKKRQ